MKVGEWTQEVQEPDTVEQVGLLLMQQYLD